MSRRRFDLGEKYRIGKNLKLKKKEVFLRGTSCLYTYLPTCVCTRVCTTFALDELYLSHSESLRVVARSSACFDFTWPRSVTLNRRSNCYGSRSREVKTRDTTRRDSLWLRCDLSSANIVQTKCKHKCKHKWANMYISRKSLLKTPLSSLALDSC
jgi:hypothetical protein